MHLFVLYTIIVIVLIGNIKYYGFFMKNLFLSGFVIFIVPMTLYAANQDGTTIDETHASIKKNILQMNAQCTSQCSFFIDVSSRTSCTKSCMSRYSGQIKFFLTRKYTNRCTGKPFNEKWSYKTDPGEKYEDFAATMKTYEACWEDPAVRRCTKKCFKQYNEKSQFVLRNLMKELQNGSIVFRNSMKESNENTKKEF